MRLDIEEVGSIHEDNLMIYRAVDTLLRHCNFGQPFFYQLTVAIKVKCRSSHLLSSPGKKSKFSVIV